MRLVVEQPLQQKQMTRVSQNAIIVYVTSLAYYCKDHISNEENLRSTQRAVYSRLKSGYI